MNIELCLGNNYGNVELNFDTLKEEYYLSLDCCVNPLTKLSLDFQTAEGILQADYTQSGKSLDKYLESKLSKETLGRFLHNFAELVVDEEGVTSVVFWDENKYSWGYRGTLIHQLEFLNDELTKESYNVK